MDGQTLTVSQGLEGLDQHDTMSTQKVYKPGVRITQNIFLVSTFVGGGWGGVGVGGVERDFKRNEHRVSF